ncbi:MAG: bifunctional [glutamate--ammonia ligase]-adenylyl-L-tyrosine phosphorylase/[glutamate--ammonia-ligase] adenylyltransferase [Pseudohongiellaceae bacterium]
MDQLEQLLLRQQARFSAVLHQQPQLESLLYNNPVLFSELRKVWTASDFAADLCCQDTDIVADLLLSGDLYTSYSDWLQHLLVCNKRLTPGSDSLNPLVRLELQLRRFRKREQLRILWRDVCGHAVLMDTCGDLTNMADVCIHFALQKLTPICQQLHGLPLDSSGNEQQLLVLAMGKYGAYELNLSSDIDLIFAFPESGETSVTPALKMLSPNLQVSSIQQYFCKLGQLLIAALDNLNSAGRVFRVDVRLRPYGNAGALALSVDAMEEYYQNQARDWERFAMIKVRVVTGTVIWQEKLMKILRAFSYRRYLDFATIDSLRDLKHQINQQVRRKGMQNDIKLGSGGIREIEFIVQVLQLIHGGKKPQLQQGALLAALDELVHEQCINAADAELLRSSYCFLRKLEHAIQGLRDQQTHTYPHDEVDELRIALTLGLISGQQLKNTLATVRKKVASHFAELISPAVSGLKQDIDPSLIAVWQSLFDRDQSLQVLTASGYTKGEQILLTLDVYRNSRQFLALEEISRQRIDKFMPLLLARMATETNPEFGFVKVFGFVQAVAKRSAYLVLLQENPLALSQLITLCTASLWIVEQLTRYPVLLDELLRPLSSPPAKPQLQDILRQQLLRVNSDTPEEQLATTQYFKLEQMLNVAAAELTTSMPLLKISDYLSWVAEVVLMQVLDIAWQQLISKFGFPINANGYSGEMEFVIIAYGKLGGLELGFGSDLDLVFIHQGHADLDTTGGSNGVAVNSTAFYTQLGQKVIALLNTQTVTGKLYEIDMRLRPSGASGVLVSSILAFSLYQHQHAWTWEHQALVRARAVAGSPSVAAAFNSIRREVLGKKRDQNILIDEIVTMRQRMRKELRTKKTTNNFHIKHDAGGLIDIEFMVQYLVLAWAYQYPQLLEFSDNVRLLELAVSCEILPAQVANKLHTIYVAYRTRLHRLALDKGDYLLAAAEYHEQRQFVLTVWNDLFASNHSPSSTAKIKQQDTP